jgi:hypothetical protein
VLKLDLAKAFDRLEWSFIESALRRQKYREHFINLIHACITLPSFAVLVNGELLPTFHSGFAKVVLSRLTFSL